MEFLASFPLYALRRLDGLELSGVTHPQTGQKVIFVFTEESEAQRFADEWGRCAVIELAATPEEFKRALQETDHEVVAFDPVIQDAKLQVRFQSLVSGLQ